MSQTSTTASLDAKFQRRLQQGWETVQGWEDALETLQEPIRQSLPWNELIGTCGGGGGGKYEQKVRDFWLQLEWEGDANIYFVQQFARYFQRHVMTWVNKPCCSNPYCPGAKYTGEEINKTMRLVTTRGPETYEEHQGQASRVEVYQCALCQHHTTFPRYNSVAKLLETKQGRCGEYANLFGLYCRAVGLETRYVIDWSDHVWVEVWIAGGAGGGSASGSTNGGGDWIMVDSCEGVVGEPSMYEMGWGKTTLCQMVAFGTHHVVDVTPRYTRKFQSHEFQQQRRTTTTSSELATEQIIFQFNQRIQGNHNNSSNSNRSSLSFGKTSYQHKLLTVKAMEQLQYRVQREVQQLERLKECTEWTVNKNPVMTSNVSYYYTQGRISGSTDWKRNRHEMGELATVSSSLSNTRGTTNLHSNNNKNNHKNDNTKDSSTTRTLVLPPESFYLTTTPQQQKSGGCATMTLWLNPHAAIMSDNPRQTIQLVQGDSTTVPAVSVSSLSSFSLASSPPAAAAAAVAQFPSISALAVSDQKLGRTGWFVSVAVFVVLSPPLSSNNNNNNSSINNKNSNHCNTTQTKEAEELVTINDTACLLDGSCSHSNNINNKNSNHCNTTRTKEAEELVTINDTAACPLDGSCSHSSSSSSLLALWQSRSFTNAQDLHLYISTLPPLVVVAMVGQLQSVATTTTTALNEETDASGKQQDKKKKKESTTNSTATETDSWSSWQRLGGFDASFLYASSSKSESASETQKDDHKETDDHLLYVGQVDAHPTSWTVCARGRDYPYGYAMSTSLTNGTTTTTSTTSTTKTEHTTKESIPNTSMSVVPTTASPIVDLCLAEYSHTRPTTIVGRLPDSFWPLERQVHASLPQKQAAVWQYWLQQQEQSERLSICGFCSQPETPIYLLGATAYPLHHCHDAAITWNNQNKKNGDKNISNTWTTCLILPKVLVPPSHRVSESILMESLPKQEVETEQKSNDDAMTKRADQGPAFQIPVDMDFFHQQVGTELVVRNSTGDTNSTLPTQIVLENCRLVGLYFSAHWCGPCRSFTPLLSQAYQTWKQQSNTASGHQGLEIIFVSSDRDAHSFDQYHGTMPWPAIPFQACQAQFKAQLSALYGIRGIPSLVILDAVSGQVVVPANVSRNEILQASQGMGQMGALFELLQQWMYQRVPASTLELLQLLETSCNEHTVAVESDQDSQVATTATTSEPEAAASTEEKDVSPYYHNDLGNRSETTISPVTTKLALPLGPHHSLFQQISLSSMSSASPNTTAASDEAEKKKKEEDSTETSLWHHIEPSARKALLETLLKYVSNCQRSPWVVKFRRLRVSNRVVDRDVTSILHALTWLTNTTTTTSTSKDERHDCFGGTSCGVQVLFQEDDYYISFPVGLDMDQLYANLHTCLEQQGEEESGDKSPSNGGSKR